MSDHDQELAQVAQAAADATCTRMRDEIREAVDDGITDALTRVGIDTDNPMEAQRDAQFVRDWRQSATSVRKKATATAVGLLVTGALAALWLGLRTLLGD